jgi:hypothetical protein
MCSDICGLRLEQPIFNDISSVMDFLTTWHQDISIEKKVKTKKKMCTPRRKKKKKKAPNPKLQLFFPPISP